MSDLGQFHAAKPKRTTPDESAKSSLRGKMKAGDYVLVMDPLVTPVDIPPWSYTFLHCFDLCAHQAYRRYVLKDLPKEESPAMVEGTAVHEAMEKRLKGKSLPAIYAHYEQFALPFDQYKVKPEMMLGVTATARPCDFFAKEVWGRGKLDVPIVYPQAAFIADWKTGNVREDPFELQVQALLLQVKYPRLKKITGRYVWLKTGELGAEHDLSNSAPTWQKIVSIMQRVNACAAVGEWGKSPNPLCGWCPVHDCEHNRRKDV